MGIRMRTRVLQAFIGGIHTLIDASMASRTAGVLVGR